MRKLVWVWLREESEGYAEFLSEFELRGGEATLYIGSDRKYAAFLNGNFVSNGQYADVPAHKSIDEADLAPFLKEGKNSLKIVAWHSDADYSAACTMTAGVAFAVVSGGKTVAASGKDTLCRRASFYAVGDMVTPQLGKGFSYDFTREEEAFGLCRVVENDFLEEPRPVKRCSVFPPAPVKVAAQGVFQLRGGETAGQLAQNAFMAPLRFSEMTGKPRLAFEDLHTPLSFAGEGGDGVYVLTDLGRETAGYLTLSVHVNRPCRALLVWGEHLSDLRIRSAVGGRSFGAFLYLKEGKNSLDEYLHRMGCRYLCLLVENSSFTLEMLTLRPTEYPFREVEYAPKDRLRRKIFDVGVRTLKLCAHEHFEDCPWREQALYGMDGRNQMVYAMELFREYDLPRAGLRLLAYSVREDGLIDLCAPAHAPITIPSFSAYWLFGVCDSAEADFNAPFVREMLPIAENMLSAFERRTTDEGIPAFHEIRYWNFHEWSEGLDGGEIFRSKPIEPYGDGILTALVLTASERVAALEERVGNLAAARKFRAYADRLASCLPRYFDEETGLYASFLKNGKRTGFHIYALSTYLLTGRIPEEHRGALLEEIKRPTVSVKPTLGALHAKYEALLRFDGDEEYILSEIEEIFPKMIYAGATSYWETEAGEADFEDAGSLCHGWSAVACWVYSRLKTE